eukprot:CAMPEP_0184298484 /NCGR_PEP_ID=MMETSP1049-20130417/9286_1 /TAXON_ID=77928 /ORGANISM="Proteomonas sulcata, Strain CCMP704" /LENGTH=190 /DNA_ID=CAMNT_0026608631 /DNA_START=321 /DNA_END=890 /DNA_ORIENTATION=+
MPLSLKSHGFMPEGSKSEEAQGPKAGGAGDLKAEGDEILGKVVGLRSQDLEVEDLDDEAWGVFQGPDCYLPLGPFLSSENELHVGPGKDRVIMKAVDGYLEIQSRPGPCVGCNDKGLHVRWNNYVPNQQVSAWGCLFLPGCLRIHTQCRWILNQDGSISPEGNRCLKLGVDNTRLCLVHDRSVQVLYFDW